MQRFWDKVNKTKNCWEWTAQLAGFGYGYFRLKGKSERAHRVSWVLRNGEIPEGLFVLHKCDNRKCVRPSHLFLGTQGDNIQDAVLKNRMATDKRHGSYTHPEKVRRGEDNTRAILTENKVHTIRKMWDAGNIEKKVLARLFGVTRQSISSIVNKRTWRHI